jgi:dTDP-4-amino-4,6-dideoxygalactose transaminase
MTSTPARDREPREQISALVPALPETETLIPYLRRIDAANWYSNYGPLWREFRDAFAAWLAERTGVERVHVAFTANGTIAIELALRAQATPGHSYCLMPSFTFVATAHAVCNAGLIPYLTDVDPYSLVLTPEIAEGALRRVPRKPAAIVVVSAFGAPIDLENWRQFERTHHIPVVFDAAAAAASLDSIGNQPLTVSLHATKVLGVGEGGAVITTDGELAKRITAMTGFGYLGDQRTSLLRGGNYRISEYTAAIGLAALAELDAKIAKLRAVVTEYRRWLGNSPVRLQEGVGDRWVTMTLNALVPENRVEDTLARFNCAGVQWRRWWGLGCHTHPAFKDLPALDLEVTRELAPRVIGVPCHTKLTAEQVATVCACLLDAA